MLNFFEIVAPLAIIALISLPIIPVLQGKVNAKNAKFRVVLQVCLFAAAFLSVIVFQLGGLVAFAAEEVAETTSFAGSFAQGMGFLAAAISTSASALGAGFAVAAAAPAA
ncbi:MAG: ATPase, partial [Erysipelotrichaceae bacterium]|nr:ATPase [Erysipelotrichaceae bacterium]